MVKLVKKKKKVNGKNVYTKINKFCSQQVVHNGATLRTFYREHSKPKNYYYNPFLSLFFNLRDTMQFLSDIL